ncbi:RimJ/RimL family protein N-acetyltransferase [Agromyces hippuratus]|uniref:RimJ/RimL family protein N-acetyltransferase n=1 Tax=Agromyces hippuratus TaxID=286438 RepID=A0A852X1G0_9MICO|nr:GNAT family protein [Agromyces hippuratus]NYG19955.1 RimJ/RimL family protein N-acetyltransferase [Agromyces hippuratus]
MPRALVLPAAVTGAGIALRAFCDDDVETVCEASRDPLIPDLTTVPRDADRRGALAYIARQHRRLRSGTGYSFAIADAADRAIGQIGLWPVRDDPGRASVGYWVVESARGNGHASAALRALSEWAWTLPSIERLELFVEPWNTGSWKAAEAAGFQREGLLRSWRVIRSERRDLLVYSRIRESGEPNVGSAHRPGA